MIISMAAHKRKKMMNMSEISRMAAQVVYMALVPLTNALIFKVIFMAMFRKTPDSVTSEPMTESRRLTMLAQNCVTKSMNGRPKRLPTLSITIPSAPPMVLAMPWACAVPLKTTTYAAKVSRRSGMSFLRECFIYQ